LTDDGGARPASRRTRTGRPSGSGREGARVRTRRATTRLAAAAAMAAVAVLTAGLAAPPGWAQARRAVLGTTAATQAAVLADQASATWHNAVAGEVETHPERYSGVVRDPATGGLLVGLTARTDTAANRQAVRAAA